MKKLPADLVYYIRSAVRSFNSGLIFTSIWVLYYSVMELSLFELSLIFLASTTANLVFEIPTGVLADVYSRRLSVILGGAFIGLAFALMGIHPVFATAIAAALIEAIGDTCVSGAEQAWITDEAGVERVGKIFLRGRQVSIPAHWLGVIMSIALAALYDILLPILLGAALWGALTVFLMAAMPETNFSPTSPSAHSGLAGWLSQFATSLRLFGEGVRMVRSSRTLLLLFLAQVFSRTFFDSFYKFSRANILLNFSLPIVSLPVLGVLKENLWFGLLEMLQGFFSLVGIQAMRRYIDLSRDGTAARLLFYFTAIILGGAILFAFTGNFLLAVAAWVVVNGLLDIGSPVTEIWLNQHVPSNVRATVISMNSQVGMLGQLGGSPALSLFGDRFGVRSALGLSAVLLAPLLALYAYSLQLSPKTREQGLPAD